MNEELRMKNEEWLCAFRSGQLKKPLESGSLVFYSLCSGLVFLLDWIALVFLDSWFFSGCLDFVTL